mgnify:CR=1 FL=1
MSNGTPETPDFLRDILPKRPRLAQPESTGKENDVPRRTLNPPVRPRKHKSTNPYRRPIRVSGSRRRLRFNPLATSTPKVVSADTEKRQKDQDKLQAPSPVLRKESIIKTTFRSKTSPTTPDTPTPLRRSARIDDSFISTDMSESPMECDTTMTTTFPNTQRPLSPVSDASDDTKGSQKSDSDEDKAGVPDGNLSDVCVVRLVSMDDFKDFENVNVTRRHSKRTPKKGRIAKRATNRKTPAHKDDDDTSDTCVVRLSPRAYDEATRRTHRRMYEARQARLGQGPSDDSTKTTETDEKSVLVRIILE